MPLGQARSDETRYKVLDLPAQAASQRDRVAGSGAAPDMNLASGPEGSVAGDREHSSFVLSNVFAGCPLKVLCAASWKCTVGVAEPCLYIIVGAESGL